VLTTKMTKKCRAATDGKKPSGILFFKEGEEKRWIAYFKRGFTGLRDPLIAIIRKQQHGPVSVTKSDAEPSENHSQSFKVSD